MKMHVKLLGVVAIAAMAHYGGNAACLLETKAENPNINAHCDIVDGAWSCEPGAGMSGLYNCERKVVVTKPSRTIGS